MTELAGSQPEKASSGWANTIRAIAIFVPIVAAIPTVFDLYASIKEDVSFWQVRHVLKQLKLSHNNFDCRPKMVYKDLVRRDVGTAKESLIFAGTCPENGDTDLRVRFSQSDLRGQRWVSFKELSSEAPGFSLHNPDFWIFSKRRRNAGAYVTQKGACGTSPDLQGDVQCLGRAG